MATETVACHKPPQEIARQRRLEPARKAIRYLVSWSAVTDWEWPRDTYYLRRNWCATTLILTISAISFIIFSVTQGSFAGVSYTGSLPLFDATPLIVLSAAGLYIVAGIAPLIYVVPKTGVVLSVTRFEFVCLVLLPLIGPIPTITAALIAATALALLYRPIRSRKRISRTLVHWVGWLGANTLITVGVFWFTFPYIGGWAFLAAGVASALEEMADRRVARWAFGENRISFACFVPLPMKFLGGLFAWIIFSLTSSLLIAMLVALAVLVFVEFFLTTVAFTIWTYWQRSALKKVVHQIESTASMVKMATDITPTQATDRLVSQAQLLLAPYALSEIWVRVADRGDGLPGVWAWELKDCLRRNNTITQLHSGDPSPAATHLWEQAMLRCPQKERGSLLIPFGEGSEEIHGEIYMVRQPNSFRLPYTAQLVGQIFAKGILDLRNSLVDRQDHLGFSGLIHESTGAINFNVWQFAARRAIEASILNDEVTAVLVAQAPLPSHVESAIDLVALPGTRSDQGERIKDQLASRVVGCLRKALAQTDSLTSNVTIGFNAQTRQTFAVISGLTPQSTEALARSLSESHLNVPVGLPGMDCRITCTTGVRWGMSLVSVELSKLEDLIINAVSDMMDPVKIAGENGEQLPAGSFIQGTKCVTQTPLSDLKALLAQSNQGRPVLDIRFSESSNLTPENRVYLNAELTLPGTTMSSDRFWSSAQNHPEITESLWGEYVRLACEGYATKHRNKIGSHQKLIIEVPRQMLSVNMNREGISQILSKAAAASQVELSDIVLKFSAADSIKDLWKQEILGTLTSAGVTFCVVNAKGLSSSPSHIVRYVSLIALTPAVTKGLIAGKSGAIALRDDIRDMAAKLSPDFRLVAHADIPITTHANHVLQRHGVNMVVLEETREERTDSNYVYAG